MRTRVRTAEGWRELQQYLVAEHAQAPVEGVEVDGLDRANPTPEVLDAIAGAGAIVIGPSNPVISIGPIVSMPAVREAIATSTAPVIAVSPYVAGQVVKGPTDLFMRAVGRPSTAAGAASLYEGLLDGMICDPEDPDPPPEGIRIDELSHADGGTRRASRAGRADPRVRLDPQAEGINPPEPGYEPRLTR